MLRLETHPRHARGEQSFTCKCHSATYGARVVLHANPPLQQRKHNASLLDTLSRHSLAQARAEHEPSEHGCQHTALLPHNLAIPVFRAIVWWFSMAFCMHAMLKKPATHVAQGDTSPSLPLTLQETAR
jgi:hypothetical protein